MGPIKQKYKTVRPFPHSKEVTTPENIVEITGGPTYPSDHCSTGALHFCWA